MQTVKELLLTDLDKVFKSIITANHREGRIMTRREICNIIAKFPAPRLYITPEYALRVFRGHHRCGASTNSYRATDMQQELRSRILSLPENMRTIANIAKVIEKPAPSFYLSPYRIHDLLYKVYRRKQTPSCTC